MRPSDSDDTPDSLRHLKNFLLYNLSTNPDGTPSDLASLSTYAIAREAADAFGCGIGFAFLPGSGQFGVEFDDCVVDGVIKPAVLAAIKGMYSEYSVSVTISGPVATVANGTITGTANHDILLGTSGNDTFLIGTGADTITGGRGADVFKYTSLSNSPTSFTAPTTTITDFSTTDGDRVDVTAILNGTSTLNSTIHVNQTGASNTSLSVTVGGVEYYIANVPNQAVSVPDAVANPASGATLTTALHGADWTTVVDVASTHGAPSTITAAGTATVTNATVNPTGDWTAIVQAGAATVDTAQSQVTFAAAPTANAVSIQTADTTVHEVSNVTAVVWHL